MLQHDVARYSRLHARKPLNSVWDRCMEQVATGTASATVSGSARPLESRQTMLCRTLHVLRRCTCPKIECSPATDAQGDQPPAAPCVPTDTEVHVPARRACSAAAPDKPYWRATGRSKATTTGGEYASAIRRACPRLVRHDACNVLCSL